jgi:peptidoglycan/LPS O-acetylase OafA/YrhL
VSEASGLGSMGVAAGSGPVVKPTERRPPDALAPPPGNPRFPLLDGWRGLALLSVVAFHAGVLVAEPPVDTAWEDLVLSMTFGPQMFLMFSGFLLYRPFVSARVYSTPRPSAGTFWRRRALRVLPAYWVALTLLAIWPGLQGDVFGEPWTYYGFLQIYSGETALSGISVAWTLGTEFSFYLALPLVVLFAERAGERYGLRRARMLELAGYAAVAIACYIWLRHFSSADPSARAKTLWLPGQAAFFAAGMTLALLSVPLPGERSVRAVIGQRWVAFSAGCFALAAAIYVVNMEGAGYVNVDRVFFLNGLLSALAIAPTVFAVREDRGPERFLNNATLGWVALISYGAYLYHTPLLHELDQEGLGGPSFPGFLLLLGVGLGLSVLLGALSYYLLERRVLRYKHRRRDAQEGARGGRAAGEPSRAESTGRA